MAVQDAKLILSENLALGAVGAHDSTNIINLGIGTDAFGTAANSDPGVGARLWLNITIDVTVAATGGASTCAWELQHCATVGGSYVNTGISIAAIAKASLTAGTIVYSGPVPRGLLQFVKLVNTVATNDVTSGTYSAWLGGPFQTAK